MCSALFQSIGNTVSFSFGKGDSYGHWNLFVVTRGFRSWHKNWNLLLPDYKRTYILVVIVANGYIKCPLFVTLRVLDPFLKFFYKILKYSKSTGDDNVPAPYNMVLNCHLLMRIILSIQSYVPSASIKHIAVWLGWGLHDKRIKIPLEENLIHDKRINMITGNSFLP